MALRDQDVLPLEDDSADDPEFARITRVRPRRVTDADLRRFESYIGEIFGACGLDLETPATARTPERFIRALFDVTEGYEGDPKLLTVFETECRGEPDCHLSQVAEGPIQVYSLCEHHGFPILGRAYVGYIAHEHILGISKLTRLVRLFAKRFTVQERLGQQIADTLEAMLEPHGVAVYIEAHHLCMQMRGVRETMPLTHTTVWRGAYASDAALRGEFLSLCGVRA